MQRARPKGRGEKPKPQPEPNPEPEPQLEEIESPTIKGFDVAPYLRRGVDKQEIISMKECFDIFDKDKSGSIDLKELNELIKQMNLESNPEKILELTQNLDFDKDNKIDFQEFLNLLSIYDFEYDDEDQLRKIFTKFADSKDAFTVDDLKRMVELVGEVYSEQQLENMIKFADWNRDQALDFEEFKQVIMKEQKKIGKAN